MFVFFSSTTLVYVDRFVRQQHPFQTRPTSHPPGWLGPRKGVTSESEEDDKSKQQQRVLKDKKHTREEKERKSARGSGQPSRGTKRTPRPPPPHTTCCSFVSAFPCRAGVLLASISFASLHFASVRSPPMYPVIFVLTTALLPWGAANR